MDNMQLLIWILEGAAGILLFKFVSLFSWDMLKYVPTPWGPFCDVHSQQKGKWYFKFWLFIAGGVSAAMLGSNYIDSHPDWMPWILLGSFSAPTVAIFLLRLLLAIGFGIFVLYERTEIIYESSKKNLVKFVASCKAASVAYLRKKGRIE